MAPRVLEQIEVNDDPEKFESQNVHVIYDEIAAHFSSTRYKPWPVISNFLSSLSTGSIGLDSGTGNGKYLPLPQDRPGDIWTIGMDRSINLLKIARRATGHNEGEAPAPFREVVWGNVLDHPWREGTFDYAISVATIHHLATHERRKVAVKRLLQAVSPDHGRVLIYVWAIEQDELSKRKVVEDEDEPPSTGKDVLVPWVLSKELSTSGKAKREIQDSQVYNRYYHMFAKGELADLVVEAAGELGLQAGPSVKMGRGLEIVQNGWERSNYYIELRLWRAE